MSLPRSSIDKKPDREALKSRVKDEGLSDGVKLFSKEKSFQWSSMHERILRDLLLIDDQIQDLSAILIDRRWMGVPSELLYGQKP